MDTKSKIGGAFRAAFPYTLPILAGFLFLGAAYGIYMRAEGFSPLYPILMAITVFAGSMEFVTVGLLLGPFNPLSAYLMTLVVNARHLFYGLSMLEKYKGTGGKKPFLIFGMCDESFAINCSTDAPEEVDRAWFMVAVTLLNYSYWVSGATLGALLGGFLHFNTHGLDFVMTALFIVIFLEQWLKEADHTGSLIGLAIPALCLVLFGKDSFIVPAMAGILAALTLLRARLEGGQQV